MKQLLILSGKGGTGKTTVSSAFIKLSNAKAFADCDVDAPNLHLVINEMGSPKVSDFIGLPKASINPDKCVRCGKCAEVCRFDAVVRKEDSFIIDEFACEGCAVCELMCPVKAITMHDAAAGKLKLYQDDEKTSVFSTAKLNMGSGTSGKLVSEVKKQMLNSEVKAELAIIDGSPGIGCPVIASISGVDFVLIVAEPSISGISDMERIIQTTLQFQTSIAVCVNKYDISLENTEKIEKYCSGNQIPFVGKIPFDNEAGKAINSGLSIVDVDCPSGVAVKNVYEKTMSLIK
ncbi:MAG: ATPase [Erysipelotrichia bacterium]|nr:ATPase [Erysipelotrichia bacterium]